MIPRFVRAALFSQPLAGSDLVFEEEFIYERDKKVYIWLKSVYLIEARGALVSPCRENSFVHSRYPSSPKV